MRFEEFEGKEYVTIGENTNGKKALINNDEIVFIDNGMRVPVLSLLQNPMLVFENTIQADESSINMPITYKDKVVGIITEITLDKIYCRIWYKYVRFYPEFNSKDGIEQFKLIGINIS